MVMGVHVYDFVSTNKLMKYWKSKLLKRFRWRGADKIAL